MHPRCSTGVLHGELKRAKGMNPSGLQRTEERRSSGAYIWEVPGKPLRVELDYGLIDRLEGEVMRAFGAVPRRGLEVGGILLGTAIAGEPNRVRIEDYEPILSRHENGPSYILSDRERRQFGEAVERWRAQSGLRSCVVGFYRSHTREGLEIGREDLELLSQFFPEETALALIVKPYATRPPVGGIFFREGATIRSKSSYLEFPFRSRELGGTALPRPEKSAPRNGHAPTVGSLERTVQPAPPPPPEPTTHHDGDADSTSTSGPRRTLNLSSGWVWIPLSVIFLLMGIALGFQTALSVRSEVGPGSGQDPYASYLTATPSAGSVHVSWDRSSPVINAAKSGRLVILDDGNERDVDLDIVQLRNGSVVYSGASGDMDFRLEVTTAKDVVVSESIEFRMESEEGR